MIPKLQPLRAAGTALDVGGTLKTLDDELGFTVHKLRGSADCAALVSRLDEPRTRIDNLKLLASTSTVTEHDIVEFIAQLNELRSDLVGALASVAAAQGHDVHWPTKFFRPPLTPPKPLIPASPRAPRGPVTVEDWRGVASERTADAEAMQKENRMLGSVYMAGYAIECSLKLLLRSREESFPTSGGAGHDLHALWKASGFQLRDLYDTNGAKTYFIEKWCTDLRYDRKLTDTNLESSELLNGAKALVGYIQTRAKRTRGHR